MDTPTLPAMPINEPRANMPDLEALRLPQDFDNNLGVRRLLVHVPVMRPNKQWFVRARPGAGWCAQVATIQLKEVNETYVVDPSLAPNLPHDVGNVILVAAINRHGTVFLWPLRVPKSSGNDPWALSALAARTVAETSWVRVTANIQAGAYDVVIATGELPGPDWPECSFEELFRLAFRDRVINSIDHPVIQRLKGAM